MASAAMPSLYRGGLWGFSGPVMSGYQCFQSVSSQQPLQGEMPDLVCVEGTLGLIIWRTLTLPPRSPGWILVLCFHQPGPRSSPHSSSGCTSNRREVKFNTLVPGYLTHNPPAKLPTVGPSVRADGASESLCTHKAAGVRAVKEVL